MTTSLERIDFISHADNPPELLGSFFWSDDLGLRCSNPDLMADMEANGIATPPDGGKVWPRDGRQFFDALKWRAGSYLEVTSPRPAG